MARTPSDGPRLARALGPRLRSSLGVLAVVALAAGLRGGHLVSLAVDPLAGVVQGDGAVYIAWADRVRGGAWVQDGAFYQDPLYPYVLALWRALAGETVVAIRVLHLLLGSAAAALLVVAGRALGGARVGVIAGLLLACWPAAIFLEGVVQKTALVTFLVAATLAHTTRLAARLGARRVSRAEAGQGPATVPALPTRRAWLGLGVLLGLWMLARGEARLTAALLGAWALVATARAGGLRAARDAGLGYALGLALTLAPAVAHNVAASGEWVLTTAQAGPNLYIGNRAGAFGTYTPLIAGRGDARREAYDARRLAEDALGRPLDSREVSAYWVGRALDDVRADPGAAARLALTKLHLALSRVEVPDTDDYHAAIPRSPVLRALAPWAHMGTLVPLALVGLVLARRRAVLAPALLVGGAQLAALVVFYVFARYRFPLVPCLVLAAAEGLGVLVAAGRRELALRAPRVALALALGAAGAVVAVWPTSAYYRPNDRLDRYHRATAMIELGRLAEAEAALAALTADAPDLVDGWATLGVVRARLGRPGEAVPAFQRARRLSPHDPRLAGQLGTALAEAGQRTEAAPLLVTAALADPRHHEVASNAALLCLQLGRVADAVRVLRARVAAAPEDVPATLQLGWLLATSKDAALRDGAATVALLAPRVGNAAGPGPWASDPRAYDVLAAGLAAVGRAADAAAVATRGADLARRAGDAALAAALEARAAHYRAGGELRE